MPIEKPTMLENLTWPMFNVLMEVKQLKAELLSECGGELDIAGGPTMKNQLSKEQRRKSIRESLVSSLSNNN